MGFNCVRSMETVLVSSAQRSDLSVGVKFKKNENTSSLSIIYSTRESFFDDGFGRGEWRPIVVVSSTVRPFLVDGISTNNTFNILLMYM